VTENEKLRALLAEAREALVRAENRMMSPPHQVPEAISSIDAALAEPLKAEYSQDEVNEMTTDMIAVRKAAERAAFLSGAEAMREAAVGASVERARYWTETSAAEGGITTMEDRAEEARSIADDIRDLPLPKDNP